MSFEGARISELRKPESGQGRSSEQRKARALAFVILAAFIEIAALLALTVCWFGTLWGISIPNSPSPYSAQDAAPYTSRANDVLLVFGVALALMVVAGIGAVLARRPFFAALQLVGLIGLLIICSRDASWAWHITHPLAPPQAPPVNYTPCYSGSNTCN
jgi:hypothetical protein